MKLPINGTVHEHTQDGFGVHYIDGVQIDKWLREAPMEDINWLAKYGFSTVVNEPDHFDNIAERIEMPHEIRSVLSAFKGDK